MRTVNHSDQGLKRGLILEQTLANGSLDDRESPMSATSANLATASAITSDESSHKNLSPANASCKASSPVASSTGSFDRMEVNDSSMAGLATLVTAIQTPL